MRSRQTTSEISTIAQILSIILDSNILLIFLYNISLVQFFASLRYCAKFFSTYFDNLIKLLESNNNCLSFKDNLIEIKKITSKSINAKEKTKIFTNKKTTTAIVFWRFKVNREILRLVFKESSNKNKECLVVIAITNDNNSSKDRKNI